MLSDGTLRRDAPDAAPNAPFVVHATMDHPSPTHRPGPPSTEAREVELERARATERASSSERRMFELVCAYADDDVFVLVKPTRAYVDDVIDAVRTDGVVRVIRDAREGGRETKLCGEEARCCHRLDRDTSGALIFARNGNAVKSLAGQFASGTVTKRYVALCAVVDDADEGTWGSGDLVRVESGHGRARYGLYRLYDVNDVDRDLPGNNRVKRCVTTIRIERVVEGVELEYCEPERDGSNARLALARCSPITGRTHQIRLHCASLGLPLAGDVRYGGPIRVKSCASASTSAIGDLPGALLHAEAITFRHPRTGEDVTVTVDPPDWAHIE